MGLGQGAALGMETSALKVGVSVVLQDVKLGWYHDPCYFLGDTRWLSCASFKAN